MENVFISDVSKQAQEVIFSRKKNIKNYPIVSFNNVPINKEYTQKQLVKKSFRRFLFYTAMAKRKGIILLNRLRVNFNHLNKRKLFLTLYILCAHAL